MSVCFEADSFLLNVEDRIHFPMTCLFGAQTRSGSLPNLTMQTIVFSRLLVPQSSLCKEISTSTNTVLGMNVIIVPLNSSLGGPFGASRQGDYLSGKPLGFPGANDGIVLHVSQSLCERASLMKSRLSKIFFSLIESELSYVKNIQLRIRPIDFPYAKTSQGTT